VHLAPGSGGGEFAPAHDAKSQALARRGGRGDPGDRVVVGERDGTQPNRQRARDDRLGRQAPIGRRGMDVEVDRCAGWRGVGIAQRRYPISGAVQDGCDRDSRSRRS
jgi:hypothetical protein